MSELAITSRRHEPTYDSVYERAIERCAFDGSELDASAHREDRFIMKFLESLGAQPARVRRMAKLLAQEALDEVVDSEGYVDPAACAALDVARLFARCSTLSMHGSVSVRERALIRDTFAAYVGRTGTKDVARSLEVLVVAASRCLIQLACEHGRVCQSATH